MKILISAAETSSDAHAAELLKALRALNQEAGGGEALDAFGIGGPRLRAEGLRVLVDARELLAMGFVELLGHLPRILRALKKIGTAVEQEKPDIAVVLDYPDFHFRLARRLKKTGVPTVYYIPPKVWAWRKRRIEVLRTLFSKVLCILPFEVEFYRRENMPVTYVGNPLVDELPMDLTRDEARRQLGLGASDRVLLLMPGSRASELTRHLSLLLDSAKVAASAVEVPLKVLLAFPETADKALMDGKIKAWLDARDTSKRAFELRVSYGESAVCMVAADAGLIKSGTSTLEAGLLRCPHCVLYKTNGFTAWVFRHLIRYRGPVGLVNLVAGWVPGQAYLVREILLEEATPENLGREALKILSEPAERERQLQGFEELRRSLLGGSGGRRLSPSRRAAQEIFDLFQQKGHS